MAEGRESLTCMEGYWRSVEVVGGWYRVVGGGWVPTLTSIWF